MNDAISLLMSREVHAVDMDASLADVERHFAETGLTWAPVLEEGRTVVGVVSVSDLLHWQAQGCDPQETRAWQLCTYKPVSASPDTPIVDVAREMVERGIHHVVVMDGDRLVGVVSSLDFVRTFVVD